jgi:predicted nucleic acid-binding protein
MKAGASSRIVLDVSVTVAWCFADESTLFAEQVLDFVAGGGLALVPAIWPFEVANALLAGERRGRISIAQVTSVLQRIADLPIAIDAVRSDRAFSPTLSLARQQQLSEYDAAYLELAMREGLPLATLEKQLRRAAKTVGAALVLS